MAPENTRSTLDLEEVKKLVEKQKESLLKKAENPISRAEKLSLDFSVKKMDEILSKIDSLILKNNIVLVGTGGVSVFFPLPPSSKDLIIPDFDSKK